MSKLHPDDGPVVIPYRNGLHLVNSQPRIQILGEKGNKREIIVSINSTNPIHRVHSRLDPAQDGPEPESA